MKADSVYQGAVVELDFIGGEAKEQLIVAFMVVERHGLGRHMQCPEDRAGVWYIDEVLRSTVLPFLQQFCQF